MKKRALSLCLVLMMALSLLTACGESQQDVGGSVSPSGGSSASSMPEQEQTSSEPGTSAEPNTSSEPDTSNEADVTEDNPLALGRINGGTYTNSYAGYGFTLDEGWTFLSAEELQQIPEQTLEALKNSEMAELTDLEGLEQFTDVFVENLETFQSMNILFQKMSAADRLALMPYSDAEIIQMTLESTGEAMISSYESAGYADISMEQVTVEFLGEERAALRTTCTYSDIPVYMLQIIDSHLGSYSVTLTITSYLEDTTGDMLALFYPVE